jgi:hypothetical protein
MSTEPQKPDEVRLANPLILNMLDVSTSHMTLKDNEQLEAEASNGLAPVYKLHDCGFLVYGGEIDHNWPPGEMSPAFRKVLEVAQRMGCEYVRFDSEGRCYSELETFEW